MQQVNHASAQRRRRIVGLEPENHYSVTPSRKMDAEPNNLVDGPQRDSFKSWHDWLFARRQWVAEQVNQPCVYCGVTGAEMMVQDPLGKEMWYHQPCADSAARRAMAELR